MVQFAQPLALWLLVLAPLPLVLSRRWRPRRRLEVANLYLWTEARQHEREGPSVRKVRRRWSAVLQAAVLALVAVALARPAMTWTAPPIAVVIDVSASMGARADGATRLSLASQVAQRELEAMPSSTHVSIIAAADAPRAVGVFSAGDPKARLAVGELETTSGGADLQSALDLAASSGASRAIVITDRQVPAARAVRVLKVGQPTDNVAVTNVVASVRDRKSTRLNSSHT